MTTTELMQPNEITDLDKWIKFLSQVEIPVLKHTTRSLNALCADEDKLNARGIANIIKHDPLMTVKMLRYLQQHKQSAQVHEVMEVEQVIMMIGIQNTRQKIPAKPLMDELLGKQHMEALVHSVRLVRRANQASMYAFDWAVRLNDLHFEEIRTAALLHDFTELLMWCFAPTKMLKIHAIQEKNKTLRSKLVQEQVLGFTLLQLHAELTKKWSLPKLLISLMDDQHTKQQRVRNVILAINLARHSANGWDNAALPDDYNDIAQLLHMQPDEVKSMVNPKD